MTSLSFSTDSSVSNLEDVLRPLRRVPAATSVAISTTSFPHVFPHRHYAFSGFLFSGIAENVQFCTGSTTITKNMTQGFVLS